MKKIIRNRAFKALVCVIVALSLGAVIAAYTHNSSTPLSSATSRCSILFSAFLHI